MNRALSRVRLFAGPNGSGKSAIKDRVVEALGGRQIGVYLNPDEIEKTWMAIGNLDLALWGIAPTRRDLFDFLDRHHQVRRRGSALASSIMRLEGTTLWCENPDSYLASALVDFLRHRLLEQGRDLCFESVMSSDDKVRFLEKASSMGSRTYLYYVATEDPEINVARVRDRVRKGGHDVPADKIRSRYQRSLDLLLPAMRTCNRAFVFDNSGADLVFVAELREGVLTLKTNAIPIWFDRHVLSKL